MSGAEKWKNAVVIPNRGGEVYVREEDETGLGKKG